MRFLHRMHRILPKFKYHIATNLYEYGLPSTMVTIGGAESAPPPWGRGHFKGRGDKG